MELVFPAGAKGNTLFFRDALVLSLPLRVSINLFFLVAVAVRRDERRRCSLELLWMSESKSTTSAFLARAVSARPLWSMLLEAAVRLTLVGTAGSEEGTEGRLPSSVDETMEGGVYPVGDSLDIFTDRLTSA